MKTKKTPDYILQLVKDKGMFYSKADFRTDLEIVAHVSVMDRNEQVDSLKKRNAESGEALRKSNLETRILNVKITDLNHHKEALELKVANLESLVEKMKVSVEGKCPTCGNIEKEYKRGVYSRIAEGLIMLSRKSKEGEFLHCSKFITNSSDFAKLAFWGLVEEMPKDENDITKRTSGLWSITQKGRDFVNNKKTIQKYIHLKNNKLIKFSGLEVGIKDCLGEKFNYEQIMTNI